MSDLIELSYVSEADHLFSENELAELLTVARCNNQKYQITGLLLIIAAKMNWLNC